MAATGDGNTSMTLNYFEFTYDKNTALTLKDFYHKYQAKLPQLVIITEGHDGTDQCESMCTDQVYRIHTFSEQCRVMAEVEGTGTVSIHVQTKSMFYVVQQSDPEIKPPKTLSTILIENEDFPIKVREERNGRRTLTLRGEYNEIYLVGNCLNDGVLFVDPVYTRLSSVIKCAVVTGIQGKSPEEFQKQLKVYSNFISQNNIKFDCTASNTEGMRFSEENLHVETAGGNLHVPTAGRSLVYLRDSSYCTMERPRTPQEEAWYKEIATTHFEPVGECIPKQNGPPTTDRNLPTNGEQVTGSYVQLTNSAESTRDVSDRHQGSRTSITRSKFEPENVDSQNRKSRRQPPPLPPGATACAVDGIQSANEDAKTEHNIDSLTVSDVGERLRQLGMKKYVHMFSKKLVDGEILACLDDKVLKDEFKLKPFDFIKLRKFIKSGHIPK